MAEVKATRIAIIFLSIILCIGMIGTFTDTAYGASKPGKVKISSVKNVTYTSVKISWKTAKNAKKYEVYRAKTKSGKYSKIKTTKEKSFQNTGLKFGQKYYYKVRAINGSKKGAYSSVKSITASLPKPVADTYVQSYRIQVYVNYDSGKGISGMKVYRAASSDGSYTLVADSEYDYCDDYNIETGVKYYYKVKTYRKQGGKTYESPYSNVVAVTAKSPYPEQRSNLNIKKTLIYDAENDPDAYIEFGYQKKYLIEITNNNDIAAEYNFEFLAIRPDGSIDGPNSNSGWDVIKPGATISRTESIWLQEGGESRFVYDVDSINKKGEFFAYEMYEDKVSTTEPVIKNIIRVWDDEVGDYVDVEEIPPGSEDVVETRVADFSVTNNAGVDLDYVDIAAIIKDKDNKIVDIPVAYTLDGEYFDTLAKGETKKLRVYLDEYNDSDIKVIPYVRDALTMTWE